MTNTNHHEELWLKGCIKRAEREVFSAHVKLTPALAQLLLERNDRNRHLTAAHVVKLERDIREGRWLLTGQGLVVSKCGLLLDGQHRCHAVINTGITVDALIVFGVDRATQQAMDIGRARKVGDVLSLDGEKNANTAAALTRLLCMWDPATQGFNERGLTVTAQTEFYYANRSLIQEAVGVSERYRRKFRGTRSPRVAFAYYVLSAIDQTAAEKFIHDLCTGEMLPGDHPAMAARNRLLNWPERMSKTRVTDIEIIFRAWLAYRAGRKLTTVKTLGVIPNPRG